MFPLTPTFLMAHEREMRAITEDEYHRRLADGNIWYDKVFRTITTKRAAERTTWFLDNVTLDPIGPSGVGELSFEDLITQTVEYPVMRHGKGLRVHRDQIEDLDGTGLEATAKWSALMGNEMAYYPQRLGAQLILNGAATNGSANAYDGIPFFADTSNPHPLNPGRASVGNYANWLHGSSSGSYPGALPIDDSVTVDVALKNMGKAIAYVAGLKMPNGLDPRFLKPAYILLPPAMAPRVRELTSAKYIAQAAATGGGSADVQALITGWGLGTPMVVNEFAASTTYPKSKVQLARSNSDGSLTAVNPPSDLTGSDTTWYLVCQEMSSTTLGGLLRIIRKPFKITYYTGDSGGTGMTETLDRANELEWHCQGRESVVYAHPYTIFRIDAS